MLKQTMLKLNDLNNHSLLSISGLAVAGEKIELSLLEGNIQQTIKNKSITIDPAMEKGATCIKAIYKTSQGLIAKVEGVSKLNADLTDVIGVIAQMMDRQKLSYVCFPALTSGAATTFHVGDTSMNFTTMTGIADVQVHGNNVLFLQVSDQRQLKSTTILDILKNSNWKKMSTPQYTFREKVRGFGRVYKTGELEVTLVNNNRLMYNISSKKFKTMESPAPQNAIALGVYRLCDKVDHAVHLFVGNAQMIFQPAIATPAAG